MTSRFYNPFQSVVAAKRKVGATLERASGWGTLIILLGISIEIWTFFGLGEHDPRERLVVLVANSLIAVGLLIEYAAIVASGGAKLAADQKVADAHQRAAEAEQRAAEAILFLQKFRSSRIVILEAANDREVIKSRLSGRGLSKFEMAFGHGDGEQADSVRAPSEALQQAWDHLSWGPVGRTLQPTLAI